MNEQVLKARLNTWPLIKVKLYRDGISIIGELSYDYKISITLFS